MGISAEAHATKRLARAVEHLAMIEAAKLTVKYGPEGVRQLIAQANKEFGPLLRKLLDNRREASDGKRKGG